MFTTGEQDHGLAHQCKQSSAGTSLHPAVSARLTAVSDEAHPRGGRGLLRCDASHGASPLLLRTIPVTGLLARTHPNAKSEIRCLACANMHPQQGVAAATRAANFSYKALYVTEQARIRHQPTTHFATSLRQR